MLFNSLSFAIFLPIVFILYWSFQNKKLVVQNVLLLVASYFFYAFWDYRFLLLLVFSTFLDYYTGRIISGKEDPFWRKFWLCQSVIINLGFLGVFKYYNFFAGSFAEALSSFGFRVHPATINVILPVGISFYTFHGISYVLDIYNRKIIPEKNIINYSVFVSFFPLLVAGPIERATHLLPQILKKRTFNYAQAVDGLRQILWGLFKKIVIADNCAAFVNSIFGNTIQYSGSTLLLGAIYFAFQIYCDFSGYSDIALGTARLFGIELLRNFAFPYFSRNIAEFWRRWHISLSSWFRDYLYIPLGGSQTNTIKKVRNIFIIFLVSGFWHGANWTFIIWGGLNALFILPSILTKTNRMNLDIVAQGKFLPSVKEIMQISFTFCLTVFAWIFFRSETLTQAMNYVSIIFSESLFTIPEQRSRMIALLIVLFMVVEWIGRENQHPLVILRKRNVITRWSFYTITAFTIWYFGVFEDRAFIYFQF